MKTRKMTRRALSEAAGINGSSIDRMLDGADVRITPTDVAIMMTLFKVARLQGNPKHIDSWVDACGYMSCGCEMETNNA